MLNKIKAYGEYIILTTIIGSTILLRYELPKELLIACVITLYLILIFYIAETLMGRTWALLPTIMIAYSPLLWNATTEELIGVLGTTTALAGFAKFLAQPSKITLMLASITLGIAFATRIDALLLIPLYSISTTIYFIASVARDWNDTDPTFRHSRFYIRGFRYYRSILIIIISGLAIVYAAYMINAIIPWLTIQKINTALVVDWLRDNRALAPIGNYGNAIINYASNIPDAPMIKNTIQKLWDETIPTLIMLMMGIILMLINGIQSIVHSIRYHSTPLLNYLGTRSEETLYIVTTLAYILIGLRTQHTLPIVLPLMIIIATLYIKYVLTNAIAERYRLKFQFTIASAHIINISVSSMLIALGILWHITATVIRFYR